MAITSFSAVSAALGPSLRRTDQNRYVYIKNQIAQVLGESDGTIRTGADTAVHVVDFGGVLFHLVPEQAAALLVDATHVGLFTMGLGAAVGGSIVPVDATDNDGIFFGLPWSDGASIGQGTLLSAGQGIFTSRTDGFFLRVKLKVATVAASDEIAIGVRKVQAMHLTALPSEPTDGSTDIAYLNVDNGTIKIGTHINDAATSVTSTTMTIADAGTVTLEVRVSESGFVKFLVNGAAPTVDVTDFRFDSGDALHCFLSVVVDVTATQPGVSIQEWEQGLLTERGLDGVNDLVN
jgi:hypothetical protein